MANPDRPGLGIRITSDPDTTRVEQPGADAARKAAALPLRLVFAADLTPHERPDPAGPRRLRSVDKHSFAELLRSLAPRLTVDVPNRLSDTPRLLEATLAFTDLKDFRPERIARQVPPLAALVDVRGLVAQVGAKEIDLDTFRTRLRELGADEDWADALYRALAAPSAPSKPAPPKRAAPSSRGDDTLDRLFGLVDTGAPEEDAAAPAPSDMLGALVDAATGSPSGPRAEGRAVDGLLRDLDASIGAQLNAVLGHPDVRRLEAAWRGLKFLVDRIDFRGGVTLDVLPVHKAGVDDALYHQVLLPAHEGDAEEPPVSAVVLGFSFSNGRDDLALLEELASTGTSLQAPIIGSVAPEFFGVEQESGLSRLPFVPQHLEGPAYIEWNKLREREDAGALALALPAFPLRYSYGPDHPADGFRFEEEGVLWGGAALAVAAAAAASFARTGWPTHLAASPLADLPLWPAPEGPSPLAARFASEKQAELADAGFVVLSRGPQPDAARVTHAPTLRRPPRRGDADAQAEADLQTSLPCALFVARAAQFMLDLQRSLGEPAPVAAVQSDVTARLRSFLQADAEAADAVIVEHVPQAATPDGEVFAVRLQPPPAALDEPVRLVLGLQVPSGGGGVAAR